MNISRSINLAQHEMIERLLELIKPHFLHQDKHNVVSRLFMILYYVSNSSKEIVDILLDHGYGKLIIGNCDSENIKIKLHALKCVGNVLGGSQEQAQIMLDLGAIPMLNLAVKSDDAELRREGFWGLSNVTAGTLDQIESVINHDIIRLSIFGLTDQDENIRLECSIVLSNLFVRGNIHHICSIVNMGILPYLSAAFQSKTNLRIIKHLLESLKGILKAALYENRLEAVKDELDFYCFQEVFLSFEHADDMSVSNLAQYILKEFYDEEDSDSLFLQDSRIETFEFS